MPLKVNPAHHALPRILRATSCAGAGLRWGGAAAAEQFQQHQRLVDGAHAHPLGDERAQAKEGSRGAGGHGGMATQAISTKPLAPLMTKGIQGLIVLP